MKHLRFIILFITFIGLVLYLNITGAEEYEENNKVLDNTIRFSGYVIDFKQSRNHAFGIIRLRLTRSNVMDFEDTLKNGIYPYKIKGTIAELYTSIPDGIGIGDIIKLKSTEKNAHYYNIRTKQNYEGYIWVITQPIDIDFVKEYTIFK